MGCVVFVEGLGWGSGAVMSAARVDLQCILMLSYKDHRQISFDWWSFSWWDVTGRSAIYATNCSNPYQVLVPAVRVVSSTFK